MSQVSPVCATVCHVDVEDGHSEGEVVLVEDSLELGVEQLATSFKARASPRIKGASLELED